MRAEAWRTRRRPPNSPGAHRPSGERHPQPTTVQNFFGLGEEQKPRTETVFEADHPEVFASEDNGITPIEYLLVGLASCLTAGVAAVAQNRGIQLRSVEATVEGTTTSTGSSASTATCATATTTSR